MEKPELDAVHAKRAIDHQLEANIDGAQADVDYTSRDLAAAKDRLDRAVYVWITNTRGIEDLTRRAAHVYWRMPDIPEIVILNAFEQQLSILLGRSKFLFPSSGASTLSSKLPPFESEIYCVDCGDLFVVKTREQLENLRAAMATAVRERFDYGPYDILRCKPCTKLRAKGAASSA